jgi:Na+-translocating ferredoxin:NAD+ oxidoreductase RnfC subunit
LTTDILQAVRAAGVVGAGGGGFPTHVKLAAHADMVIANGAECEPLVRSDRTLMAGEPERVLRGLRLAMQATGATRGLVALKHEAIQARRALEAALKGATDIALAPLDSYYPTGDEFVLVQTLTGRNVPEGGLPRDVGVLVQNVATLAQIAAAVDGVPVTERLVTVVGEVARPCVLRVPLGTSVRQVIAWAGGITQSEDELAVVAGGAMMGRLIGWDAPIIKTCGALFVLPRQGPVVEMLTRSPAVALRRGRSACDQCRDCTDLCPRSLLGHALKPHEIMRSINYGLAEPTSIVTAAALCSECRLCEAYACPLGLSPLAYYRACKAELRRQGWQNTAHRRADVQPLQELEDRRVPVSRLTDKLGLTAYASRVPAVDMTEHAPNVVCLPLKQHAGAAARAVVQVGQSVQRGDLLGEIPEGALGARVHASIDGVVAALTAETITLERRVSTRQVSGER